MHGVWTAGPVPEHYLQARGYSGLSNITYIDYSHRLMWKMCYYLLIIYKMLAWHVRNRRAQNLKEITDYAISKENDFNVF